MRIKIAASILVLGTVVPSLATAQAPWVTQNELGDVTYDFEITIVGKLIDLNQDGTLDIVLSGYGGTTGSEATLWLDNQNGLGDDFQTRQINMVEANDFEIIDIDSDGDLDILSPGDFGSLLWWENVADARAWTEHSIAGEDGYEFVAAADFDGDGDTDVLGWIDDFTDYRLLYFDNDGAQGWASPIRVGTDENVVALEVGDFDGDGDVDAVQITTFNDDRRFKMLRNDGTFWTPGTEISMVGDVSNMEVADIDGDGDLDVMVTTDQRVYFVENVAPEVFAVDDLSGDLNPGGFGSYFGTLADLDDDGDLDIITVSGQQLGTMVWRNEDNSFTREQIDEERRNANTLDAADIDCDGDIDLLYTHGNGEFGTNRWFENETVRADDESCHLNGGPNNNGNNTPGNNTTGNNTTGPNNTTGGNNGTTGGNNSTSGGNNANNSNNSNNGSDDDDGDSSEDALGCGTVSAAPEPLLLLGLLFVGRRRRRSER